MNMEINIPGLNLSNPIIPASGTFGFGYEFTNFYDINILGSIALKGTTLEIRYGNSLPRIAEAKSGMLNAVGLQNPGVKEVVDAELLKLSKVYSKKVIANVAGSSFEDYIECAKHFDKVDMIGILEINVSCPNVKEGGIAFGTDSEMVYKLVKELKCVCKKPIYVKLSPNVTNIVEIAISCEKAGADGISMINTLLGMRIDVKNRKPILANKKGGFSGPAIFPVALRMIYEVYEKVSIPIIGMGGVMNAYDVIEMMMAGASCVQVGSANLINPNACEQIIYDLPIVMKELGIEKLSDIIGGAHE